MPRLTENVEFCPIARAMEVLGERWALLIVRDLITGPKRFGELQRLVVGITPKWLTTRLRALEVAGIVEHVDRSYRLTPKGEGLRPLIEDLAIWSTQHDLRPPKRGEVIIAEHEMWGLETYLNRNEAKLPRPVTWLIRLTDESLHTLQYDGTSWAWKPNALENELVADVSLTTTARRWAELLANAHAGKQTKPSGYSLVGAAPRVREFTRLFRLTSSD